MNAGSVGVAEAGEAMAADVVRMAEHFEAPATSVVAISRHQGIGLGTRSGVFPLRVHTLAAA